MPLKIPGENRISLKRTEIESMKFSLKMRVSFAMSQGCPTLNKKCHFEEISVTGCTGSFILTTSGAASDEIASNIILFRFGDIAIFRNHKMFLWYIDAWTKWPQHADDIFIASYGKKNIFSFEFHFVPQVIAHASSAISSVWRQT